MIRPTGRRRCWGSVFSFLRLPSLLILLLAGGCAAKRPVQVWRFTRCIQNGDHWVCECSRAHTLLDAKTGNEVKVCD